MNHLSSSFYTMPLFTSQMMSRKQVKETLMETGGWIMACGYMWDIQSKHLGAGAYRVTLKQRE